MRRTRLHASRFLRIGLGSLLLAAAGIGAGSPLDGTETLGVPVGINPPVGTDFVMAGVGLNQVQPGTIDLTVPDGVAIVQVLAYWEGLAKTAEEQGDTDVVTIGGIEVTGVRIGGPTQWVHADQRFTSSYRADITDLGLVVNGPNSIEVSGLDFTLSNDGMSLVVVIDDGSGATLLDLQDGNDSAYFNWPAPLDTTVPVTYAFPPASFDRSASLGFVVGSVDRHPTIIEISFDGVVAIQMMCGMSC